ncbi:MAG TPA: hypothetical protein VGO50_18055 [Pyrinomonadaceae bacterium]|jgi:hypothetical protein|nr:hypothetical protein [Pyrinomonadaceae bacterium]
MSYIFRGRLCSYICSECRNPLRFVKVRLYRLDGSDNVIDRAVANAKDTFAILDDKAIKAKQSLLIAEAETDAEGNYSFELSEKLNYDGGAFEVDVYVDSVGEEEKIKTEKPVQFSITVLKPQWRRIEDQLVWGWEYCLPYRWWCLILSYLGLWVICGRVLLCEDRRKPIPGVKVIAFDRDWLQDDMLGSAITNSAGQFHIYYTKPQFEPGTFWNVELTSGPDLYFRVETLTGAPLLVEPPSRGRDAGRENVGHCFCVTLCVKEGDVPDDPEPLPFFSHLGVYNYSTAVGSAPAGDGLTNSGDRAFFSTVRLNGILSKKFNGNPMEYRFEVRPLNSAGLPTGPWAKVGIGQVGKTYIGKLERANPAFPATDPNPIEALDYVVGAAGVGELSASVFSDAQGDWIQVPQETSSPLGPVGYFTPSGDMIRLDTTSIAAWPVIDLIAPTTLVAGNSVTSTGIALVKDKYFSIRMLVREQGTAAAGTQAGICQKVAIENTIYKTKNHPSWMPTFPVANGVGMVDIAQMILAGCSGITNDLDVLFTAAHPNLGGVSISMDGPGGPYSFTLPAPASPGEDHFGTAVNGFTVGDLQKCAYIVKLYVEILLTTGDWNHSGLYDQIPFCKA